MNTPLFLKVIFIKSKGNIAASTAGQYWSTPDDTATFYLPNKRAIPFLASMIGKNMMMAAAILTQVIDIPTQIP